MGGADPEEDRLLWNLIQSKKQNRGPSDLKQAKTHQEQSTTHLTCVRVLWCWVTSHV